MSRLTPLLTVMVEAAQKAGRALRRDFGEVEQLQVSRKGPADFVTKADTKAESILVTALQKARPAYGFLNEEGGEIEGSDISNRWIIDPLDGTTNFLHGIPHFAVSVALERDRRIEAGVVYNPITDDLYYAERGKGAFCGTRGYVCRVASTSTNPFLRRASRSWVAPTTTSLSKSLRP